MNLPIDNCHNTNIYTLIYLYCVCRYLVCILYRFAMVQRFSQGINTFWATAETVALNCKYTVLKKNSVVLFLC